MAEPNAASRAFVRFVGMSIAVAVMRISAAHDTCVVIQNLRNRRADASAIAQVESIRPRFSADICLPAGKSNTRLDA